MKRLLAFPFYSDNAFQEVAYRALADDGVTVLTCQQLAEFGELATQLQRGDVIHINWTAPVLQPADDIDDARGRLHSFTGLIQRSILHGIGVVWTIHNVLPHDLKFASLEVALHQFLADTVDIVHVMSEETVRLVEPHYAVQLDSVRVVPHPSYLGVYRSAADRGAARLRRGLADSDKAVMFLGQVRSYKGIEKLIHATALAQQSDPTLALLVAGRSSPEYAQKLRDLVPNTLRFNGHFDFVADDDIAEWFASADVIVLPYESILNSGSVHLAATFGRPVILPAFAHLRRQFDKESWVTFYEPDGSDAALAEAILRVKPASDDVTTDAFRFSEARHPSRIAVDMAQMFSSIPKRNIFRRLGQFVRTRASGRLYR